MWDVEGLEWNRQQFRRKTSCRGRMEGRVVGVWRKGDMKGEVGAERDSRCTVVQGQEKF